MGFWVFVVGSKRFVFGVNRVRNEILRSLNSCRDFNVCLDDVVSIVERFDKRCVPLSVIQIVRLKVLHRKFWACPVA